jgi:hypothetical protein
MLGRMCIPIVAIMLACGVAQGALAQDAAKRPEDARKAIQYLLDTVAKSDVTFIRNGEPHDGKQASAHMAGKYQHFAKEIHTPEDFIRLAGTRSEITGKAYEVKLRDGKTMPAGQWLSLLLADYRKR